VVIEESILPTLFAAKDSVESDVFMLDRPILAVKQVAIAVTVCCDFEPG
jgi:hypothetical protein